MKRGFFLFIMIFLFVSCKSKKTGEIVLKKDTGDIHVRIDTASIKTDTHYFWSSELDPQKGLIMQRTVPLPEDSLTVPIILQMLNEQYPEIQLRFNKMSNDSIFVKINNSNYLTQRMGSSGAECYLAEVTYNLTEIKDIHFVVIRFKAGDHASPATYSRTDFIKIKK